MDKENNVHVFLEDLISHLNNGMLPTTTVPPASLFHGMRMHRVYSEYLVLRTQPCGSLRSVPPSLLPGNIRGQAEYFLHSAPNGLILFAVTWKGVFRLSNDWIRHLLQTTRRLPNA